MASEPITVIGQLRGCGYYKGAVRRASKLVKGEGVIVTRDPGNPYDINAVSVLSSEDKMLGHLDRITAAMIAPHMDNGVVYISSVFTPPKTRGPYLKKGSVTIKCVPLPPLKKKKYATGPILEVVDEEDIPEGLVWTTIKVIR